MVFSLAQDVGSVSPWEGLLWDGVRNIFNLDPALLRKSGQIGGELSFELYVRKIKNEGLHELAEGFPNNHAGVRVQKFWERSTWEMST